MSEFGPNVSVSPRLLAHHAHRRDQIADAIRRMADRLESLAVINSDMLSTDETAAFCAASWALDELSANIAGKEMQTRRIFAGRNG